MIVVVVVVIVVANVDVYNEHNNYIHRFLVESSGANKHLYITPIVYCAIATLH